MLRRVHRDLVRPAVRLGADWPLDMRLARDPFFQRLDRRRAVALVADPVDMGDARLPLDEGDQRMFVPVMRDAQIPRGQPQRDQLGGEGAEIGRASCRERVCQYVSVWVVAVSLKKKKQIKT